MSLESVVSGAVGGLVTFVALLLLVQITEWVQKWRKKRKVTK